MTEKLQEKYPLEEPWYWSTFNAAPAIKIRKSAAGTIADWYIFSAGGPNNSEKERSIVCHPTKSKARLVAEMCPYDELAHVMYHMFLLGVGND